MGTVTVEFPIPEDQYEATIRALEKIKIGTTLDKDCCVADLRSTDCPALCRMIGRMVNVDELDWLGKQLESFDRYELLQFNAAAERFGLSSMGEMMDLSFCSREVTVISDFNDLESVGRRHYLTLLITGTPEEQGALVGTETAQRLIANQTGHVTQYGVVYDNSMKLEQVYDGKHLPQSWWAENCLMELEIGARGEADKKKFEWVQLPASQIKLERAMLRAGIPSCGEIQLLFSGSRFPDEVDCALDFEHESLFELNRLCQVCSNFKEQDFEKLGAVCQMAKPACAANGGVRHKGKICEWPRLPFVWKHSCAPQWTSQGWNAAIRLSRLWEVLRHYNKLYRIWQQKSFTRMGKVYQLYDGRLAHS